MKYQSSISSVLALLLVGQAAGLTANQTDIAHTSSTLDAQTYTDVRSASQAYARAVDDKQFSQLADVVSPNVSVNFFGDVVDGRDAFEDRLHGIVDDLSTIHQHSTQTLLWADEGSQGANTTTTGPVYVKTAVSADLFLGNLTVNTKGYYVDLFDRKPDHTGYWLVERIILVVGVPVGDLRLLNRTLFEPLLQGPK
ncbi:MAG: hypothetical protein M1838_000035 [Thelocarpon superellum]|nr:MAG: hypothetical protein M1838_000035 [Thelocarpon superellum]